MSNEITLMFNAEDKYLNSFLDDIKGKLCDVFLQTENFIVYQKELFEVMLDKHGTVFISGKFDSSNRSINLIDAAVEEYSNLSKLEARYLNNKEFKIIIPHDLTFEINKTLKDLSYRFKEVPLEDKNTFNVYFH